MDGFQCDYCHDLSSLPRSANQSAERSGLSSGGESNIVLLSPFCMHVPGNLCERSGLLFCLNVWIYVEHVIFQKGGICNHPIFIRKNHALFKTKQQTKKDKKKIKKY
jgi:hypothetical protein